MNRSIPFFRIGFLCYFLLSTSLFAHTTTNQTNAPVADETYYVLAPSGLNLRKSADPKSEKIGHIAYGEPLSLLKPSFDISMEVDKIKGGMAKVNYKGTIAYAFDGYLSKFPSPKGLRETKDYMERARDAGVEILYEECNRDYGGYFQYETSFTLPGQNWPHAFLVAKQLHRVPKGFNLPATTGTKESDKTTPNPEKNENAWTDELHVEYDENGQIALIEYAYRGEGTGQSVSWQYDKNFNAIRIVHVAIAD